MLSVSPLLNRIGEHPRQRELAEWAQASIRLETTDFHRLQIERWLWDNRERMGPDIVDVGQAENRRNWLGSQYRTLGMYGCDITADICYVIEMTRQVDTIVCTEVMEHVRNPFYAVENLYKLLKRGGRLFLSTPFLWPWHGTDSPANPYPDFWRFTDEGLRYLLRDFADVIIQQIEWTPEGEEGYEIMRLWEALGYPELTRAATGYVAEARRS